MVTCGLYKTEVPFSLKGVYFTVAATKKSINRFISANRTFYEILVLPVTGSDRGLFNWHITSLSSQSCAVLCP